jgi:hypothetical protein
MYLCPHCGEDINQSTEVCPHCRADLTQPLEGEVLKPPPPLRSILIRWGIIIGVIGAFLWGFLWYILPAQHGDVAARAEQTAVASLNDLRAALASYATGQPDGAFPGSLEPLGDRAREAAQLALSVGYQLSYTPAPPSSDGVVRGYSLQARAGNFGFRSFYLDQTGTLRATKENRPAVSSDPAL